MRRILFLSIWLFSTVAASGSVVIESLPSFASVSDQSEAVKVIFDLYVPDENGSTNGVNLNAPSPFTGFWDGLNGHPSIGLIVEGSKGQVVFADYYSTLTTSDIAGGNFQSTTSPDSGTIITFIFVDPADKMVAKTVSRVAFALSAATMSDDVRASFIALDGTVLYTTGTLSGDCAYVARDSITGAEIPVIYKLQLTSMGTPPQLWTIGHTGDSVTTDFAFCYVPPATILTESDNVTKVVEGGADDTYSIVLGRGVPVADVNILIADSANPSQVQFLINGVSGNIVTFTSSNWNIPQIITVQAVDDSASEATHYTIINHSSTSADSEYDNAEIKDVRVRIADNDGSCIKVFLIGGQSNAAGSGLNTEFPALYQTLQYDVEFWNGGRFTGDGVPSYSWDRNADTEFRPLQLGSGNYVAGTHSGVEMSLGRAIKDALPNDKIAVVKYGMSGSALYRGLRPEGAGDWDSDPAPLGSSFDGVRYHVFKHSAVLPALQAITNRGDAYEIAGMFWMQGETDAGNLTAANAYEANLYKLINAVRTEFSAPNMKFIIGRIRTVMGAYNGTVRTAMLNVAAADPLTEWINTDDIPVNSDNIHYSSLGLVELGERFAEAYLATLSMQGDFDLDGDVDMVDFAKFAEQWLIGDCGSCYSADFNNDLDVNFEDFLYITENWLES